MPDKTIINEGSHSNCARACKYLRTCCIIVFTSHDIHERHDFIVHHDLQVMIFLSYVCVYVHNVLLLLSLWRFSRCMGSAFPFFILLRHSPLQSFLILPSYLFEILCPVTTLFHLTFGIPCIVLSAISKFHTLRLQVQTIVTKILFGRVPCRSPSVLTSGDIPACRLSCSSWPW